jgi:hypothetical protein
MPGHLGDCLGLPLHTPELVHGFLLHRWNEMRGFPGRDGWFVAQWHEPSGAALGVNIRDGIIGEVIPFFAGSSTTKLVNVTPLAAAGPRAVADVVDDAGNLLTRCCADLIQWPCVEPGASVHGDAVLSGMALTLSIYEDAAAFDWSSDALLDTRADPPWRYAVPSFLPIGMFEPEPQAIAWLAGTVREAWTLDVPTTGREFDCARVETAGFDVYVCWPADLADNAVAGNVIAGQVYLSANLPALCHAPDLVTSTVLAEDRVDEFRSWTPYSGGSTRGDRGSEDGIIIVDDEHPAGARITLERDCRSGGRVPIPFAITCGIYGSMVHTRYFADGTQARSEFDAMKNALARIVEQAMPDGSAADPTAALTDFVKHYP